MEKKEPWDVQKHSSIIKLRMGNLKYRDSYKELKAKASLLEFQISLEKGRLDRAYVLQYKGYRDYLIMAKDLGAEAYFATHLIPRET
ncbi:MAG: hypothetical protein GWN64_17085 [Candidatus Thorarchaeota archaeon]|nr:hypothetical protein [Candidatus Thorarchaeota archaeon]